MAHELGVSDYGKAVAAWRVAEFPLITPEDAHRIGKVLITEREIYGNEGVHDASFYTPDEYQLVDDEGEDRTSQAWRELIEKQTAVYPKTILTVNLGRYGARAATDVLGESLFVARNRHHATLAITAGNVLISREAGRPSEAWMSIWDNGEQYGSGELLDAGFSRDIHRTLQRADERGSQSTEPIVDENVFPTTIVTTAAAVLRGSLSVLSGTHRLDIRRVGEEMPPVYEFQHSTTEGIEGNLIIARLPYIKRAVDQHKIEVS